MLGPALAWLRQSRMLPVLHRTDSLRLNPIFIMALVGTTGRDQQMAIHLLLLLSHSPPPSQPSNGPIRAEQMTLSSSVIG